MYTQVHAFLSLILWHYLLHWREYSRDPNSRGKYTNDASHSSTTLPSSLLYVLGIAVAARHNQNSELGYNRDEHCVTTKIKFWFWVASQCVYSCNVVLHTFCTFSKS